MKKAYFVSQILTFAFMGIFLLTIVIFLLTLFPIHFSKSILFINLFILIGSIIFMIFTYILYSIKYDEQIKEDLAQVHHNLSDTSQDSNISKLMLFKEKHVSSYSNKIIYGNEYKYLYCTVRKSNVLFDFISKIFTILLGEGGFLKSITLFSYFKGDYYIFDQTIDSDRYYTNHKNINIPIEKEIQRDLLCQEMIDELKNKKIYIGVYKNKLHIAVQNKVSLLKKQLFKKYQPKWEINQQLRKLIFKLTFDLMEKRDG